MHRDYCHLLVWRVTSSDSLFGWQVYSLWCVQVRLFGPDAGDMRWLVFMLFCCLELQIDPLKTWESSLLTSDRACLKRQTDPSSDLKCKYCNIVVPLGGAALAPSRPSLDFYLKPNHKAAPLFHLLFGRQLFHFEQKRSQILCFSLFAVLSEMEPRSVPGSVFLYCRRALFEISPWSS